MNTTNDEYLRTATAIGEFIGYSRRHIPALKANLALPVYLLNNRWEGKKEDLAKWKDSQRKRYLKNPCQ